MGTMLFYGAIHIAQWQTSKELIADANLIAQCEWTLSLCLCVSESVYVWLVCACTHKKVLDQFPTWRLQSKRNSYLHREIQSVIGVFTNHTEYDII